MLRIVGDERAVGPGQQVEGGLRYAALEAGIVGNAERSAKLKGHPEGARRAHHLGVFAHQADTRCRNALPLEEMTERAHGARAGGSNRDEERSVDLVGLEQSHESHRNVSF